MLRFLLISFIVLAFVICCTTSGLANTVQSPFEMEDSELLEILKLDPVITNACKSDPDDTPLRALQRERCYTRLIVMAKFQVLMDINKYHYTSLPEMLKVPGTLSENLIELMDKPEDKIKCHELGIEFLKYTEKFMSGRADQGNEFSENLKMVKAARINSEIELLKLKEQIEKSKK
jgi:hypothetical protein